MHRWFCTSYYPEFCISFSTSLPCSEPPFSSLSFRLHLFLRQISEQDVWLTLSLAHFLFASFISPPSSSMLWARGGEKDGIRQVWCSPYRYFTRATHFLSAVKEKHHRHEQNLRERSNSLNAPRELSNCKNSICHYLGASTETFSSTNCGLLKYSSPCIYMNP